MQAPDTKIRLAAFRWLEERSARQDAFTRSELATGFPVDDIRVPLVAPQGIYKPKVLQYPLSITTSPDSPYADRFGKNVLYYAYRGTDPMHRDNVGLRECMTRRLPLVYLYGVAVNKYLAVWPVYIVGDEPNRHMFAVEADDNLELLANPYEKEKDVYRRRYVTAAVKVRLHRRDFRERVLRAYRASCTLCNLRHEELLDAAHILPDAHPEGEPQVPNGLSLCKLHHSAYDAKLIGISPDYQVNVRADILEEEDGPVLQHGLKGMHERRIVLPNQKSNWPDREKLAERYEGFLLYRT